MKAISLFNGMKQLMRETCSDLTSVGLQQWAYNNGYCRAFSVSREVCMILCGEMLHAPVRTTIQIQFQQQVNKQ